MMMKFLLFSLSLWLFIGLQLLYPSTLKGATQECVVAGNLLYALENIADISSVTAIDRGEFVEKYVVMINQPLNYSKPGNGNFEQQFVVCHRGYDRPTVMVTEGYGGDYALKKTYMNELAQKLNANVVVIEHRFFAKSTPSPRNWNDLTIEASMNDLHRVNVAMRNIYKEKWISTGISKGGSTTIMYKCYFPDDVDLAVPYVAPICFNLEDNRIQSFLDRCGTVSERKKILDYQREILKRRVEIMPMFDEYCAEMGFKFTIASDEILDLCVLEYSVSFWQWGMSVASIPTPDQDTESLFKYLVGSVSPDYFTVDNDPSFFVQSAREFGYYGYDTAPFEGLLKIKSSKGYLERVLLPEDAKGVKFSNKISKNVFKYLKNNDPEMIFIYGEHDPWTAAAPKKTLFDSKQNMIMMVESGGSHRARIKTLSEAQQKEVWNKIYGFLK